MIYAKAFFDLQLQFANKVAQLLGLPLPRVLLDYTNLYIRFGLGRTFDAAHPIWQTYLTGLQNSTDHHDWTYRFYLTRAQVMAGPAVDATFGCFSYAHLPEDRIHLHFHNSDTDKHSSLASACRGQRLADLIALFKHVQRTLPQQIQVVGMSWLYNLEAYSRLFPCAYIATARVMKNRFRSLPLWGQFLDRQGNTKEHMTDPFLECLERQVNIKHLNDCFPFQVLTVKAPVRAFYAFYGIS
jgi:hypothetical protein